MRSFYLIKKINTNKISSEYLEITLALLFRKDFNGLREPLSVAHLFKNHRKRSFAGDLRVICGIAFSTTADSPQTT
jgi:hypothetical protein